MPRSKSILYRFNRGELDPKLDGRAELESYYASAEELQNVLVLPQGGLRRRFGLLYRDEVRNTISAVSSGTITASDPQTNGGTTANLLDGNPASKMTNTTGVSTTDDYIAWQLDLGSLKDVAFVDIKNITLSAGTTTEFELEKSDDASTWTSLSSPLETQHTLTLDQTERFYRLAVDDNARYFRLIRNGTTDLGAGVVATGEASVWIDDGTLGSYTRLTRFEFNDDQSYAFLFTDENLAVYLDGALQANVQSPYTDGQLSLFNYDQDHDTAIFVHEDVAQHELKRQGGHNLWRFTSLEDAAVTPEVFSNVPLYNYSVAESNPAFALSLDSTSGTVKITDTASGGNFASSWVGNYIEGNGGRARIVKFIDTDNVLAQTELNFFESGSGVIALGAWTRETGWSNLWNSTNGYPRAVCFYKGRLVFGGFKGAPEVIAASVVGDYYNFAEGTLGDSNAFYFAIDSKKANVIYHFHSHDNLEIFCSESEWVVKSTDDFTPTGKTKFAKQSNEGIKPEIKPEDIEDGGTLYVQAGGQNLKEFIFSDETLSYRNDPISIFSNHLVNLPVDGSIRHNTSSDESTLYLLVNSDGNLVIATMLKSQKITGFAEQITDGDFKNVLGLSDDIFCVVERTIDGTTKRYLEEFVYDRLTDSSIYMLAADSRISGTTVSGLDHLEGESVWTIIDGSVYGPETVSSGAITLDKSVSTDLEVGLDFDVNIITNPIESPEAVGPLMGNRKSISEIIVNVYDTQHMLVNGYSPFKQTLSASSSGSTIDSAPKSHTNRFRMVGFRGWDDLGRITITQDYPLKMTLLNIGLIFNYGK